MTGLNLPLVCVIEFDKLPTVICSIISRDKHALIAIMITTIPATQNVRSRIPGTMIVSSATQSASLVVGLTLFSAFLVMILTIGSMTEEQFAQRLVGMESYMVTTIVMMGISTGMMAVLKTAIMNQGLTVCLERHGPQLFVLNGVGTGEGTTCNVMMGIY